MRASLAERAASLSPRRRRLAGACAAGVALDRGRPLPWCPSVNAHERRGVRYPEARGLEAELRAEIKAVRTDLRGLEHRMTIRLGGVLAAPIVLVGAMPKLL